MNHRPRAARPVEVRHLADGPRRSRSADGEVPAELLDAAAADLRPGRASSWACSGAAITGWLAYQRLFGYQSIANRPLLLFGILLIFTGVQLVTLGLLAELQARTYHESQNKPTYVIREIREASGIAPGAERPVAPGV